MSNTTLFCKKCSQELPIQEFARNPSRKNGLNDWCKSCYKQYFAEYYKNNKEKHRAIAYSVNTKKSRYLKNLVNTIKESRGCINCGENCPECLDFHHLDPKQKNFSIAEYMRKKSNPDTVLKEIEKCVVVCANCHRKIHSGKLKIVV